MLHCEGHANAMACDSRRERALCCVLKLQMQEAAFKHRENSSDDFGGEKQGESQEQ